MVAEKRISKQGAHDADHLEEDDVDEGEGDIPDDGGALMKVWNLELLNRRVKSSPGIYF